MLLGPATSIANGCSRGRTIGSGSANPCRTPQERRMACKVRHPLSHGPRAWLAVVGGFSQQMWVGVSDGLGLPLGSSLRRVCAGCQFVQVAAVS